MDKTFDVLEAINTEIEAVRLQVERGMAPKHALDDMKEVRSAVADLIGQRDELARLLRIVHDGNTKGRDRDSVLGEMAYAAYMDSDVGQATAAILKRVGGRHAHN